MVQALQDYLFDLRGYLILENAVDSGHIADLNAAFDAFPPLEWGEWHGNVQRFERLIDHPSWVNLLMHYCGWQGASRGQHRYKDGLFRCGQVNILLTLSDVGPGTTLFFVDSLAHGASSRTNPGERRATIYRYGVSWGNMRYGYEYSQELLDQLTSERRAILQPIAPRRPPQVEA